MEKKAKLFLKKCPKRLISLLLCFVLVALMFPAFELHAQAEGISEYEFDGHDYYVEWDSEWGHGTVFTYCDYCSQGYGREITDGDHEGCISDIYDADFLDCGHCLMCKGDYHCPVAGCGKCPELDPDECTSCNSLICLSCHLEDYFCDVCGECRLEDGADGLHFTGYHELTLPGIDALCGDCYNSIDYCIECGRLALAVQGMWIAEGDYCEECELCRECVANPTLRAEYGHCISCGVCGKEEDVCEECKRCDDCIEELSNHCPECDECWGNEEYEKCAQGGEHCTHCCNNNNWICDQCHECTEGKELEVCDECGLCIDCCRENIDDTGCIHNDCIKTSDYEDHLCPDCGECPKDTECEYCGYCVECASYYHCEHDICPENEDEWEEHLCDNCGNCFELDELCEFCHMCEGCWEHCQHGLCPEESEYDDHICDNCGECFEEDEFCEYCGLCPACCEDNTLDMDCDHELCVESPDFAEHYCFEHFQCIEYCDHYEDCEHEDVSATWSKNAAAHWHKCLLCGGSADAEPHIAGEPVIIQKPDALTRTMGVAKISCKVCGQSMGKTPIPYTVATSDGSPYILSQPKDYEGRVSVFSSEEADCRLRYASFTVIAGGENNTYQWYYRVDGGAAKKLTDEIGDEDFYEMSGKPEVSGSTKNRLSVLVEDTSCHRKYEYWCVVTNAKGTAATRYAQLKAEHDFSGFKSIDADTHIRCCVGWGCTETRGNATDHRFGPWTVDYIATTTRKGQRHRVCDDCGYYEINPIPMIEEEHQHNYVKYGYTSTMHWKECMCGKKSAWTGAHDFAEGWTVLQEPTEHRAGKRVRTCHYCFYEEYEIIEKLPHTHNYTTKIDTKKGRYDFPNGRFDKDYHYVNCADKNCTSWHREKHTYHSWNVMHLPFTDRKGKYHSGLMYRNCTECGYSQQEKFDNKWPILTEVFNADSSSGFSGAVISGPTSANKGDFVTLTIELQEGFIPDLSAASDNGWSLNEVTSYDGIYIKDTFYPYQNQNGGTLRQTFSTNPTTYSATFTMPDGPVALGFFVEECDHKGIRTHRDTIEATCTGYGSTVDRCNKCNGIVKEISRNDPTGHHWGFNRWIQQGDCNTLDIYEQKCIYCGKTREHDDGYHHQWFDLENAVEPSCFTPGHKTDVKYSLCGEYLYGDTIKAIGHHNWGDWVVTKEPTNKTKGEQYRQCKKCGDIQEQILDYEGANYELKPDKKFIKFDFTYGDEVEPQYITFTSTGRDPVRRITGINLTDFGQDAAYTAEIVGNMTVKITPNMDAIPGYDSEELEHLVVTGTDVSGEPEVPEISISSTIRKSQEKYRIIVDGGTAEWEKTYTTRKGASIDTLAGCELRLTAKYRDDFDHWEVVYDTSGLVKKQLEAANYTNSPTAYIMLPQNEVKLKAVYKHVRKIEIDDLFLPVAGAAPRFDVSYDTGLYSINSMRWVQADNGHELTSSETFTSGKKYYAEFYLKPKGGFKLDEETLKGNVFINGTTDLVDENWTKAYSQQAGWYLVTTNDIDVTAARTITALDVAVDKPAVGYTLDYSPSLSSKYAEIANSRTRVQWYDISRGSSALGSSETIKEGHSYSVVIKLTAKNGYQFAYGNGGTAVTVNGNAAASFTGTADSATLKYDFIDKYAILDLNVTGIKEPVAGQSPSYTAEVPDGGHYRLLGSSGMRKNGIMWQDENGKYLDPNDPSAKFESGKKYSCTVMVEPNANEYHIAKDICAASVNGQPAEIMNTGAVARYAILKYTFTCAAGAHAIGDANLDGSITISDVTEIQKYLAEMVVFSDEQLLLADTNGDGLINITDATHLQKYLAEFDGIVLGKPAA